MCCNDIILCDSATAAKTVVRRHGCGQSGCRSFRQQSQTNVTFQKEADKIESPQKKNLSLKYDPNTNKNDDTITRFTTSQQDLLLSMKPISLPSLTVISSPSWNLYLSTLFYSLVSPVASLMRSSSSALLFCAPSSTTSSPSSPLRFILVTLCILSGKLYGLPYIHYKPQGILCRRYKLKLGPTLVFKFFIFSSILLRYLYVLLQYDVYVLH